MLVELGLRLNLRQSNAFTRILQCLWKSIIVSWPTSKLPRFSMQIALAFAPLMPAGALSKDLHTASVPSGNVVTFCAISLKTSLQVCRLHRDEPFKVIMSTEILIRRNKSVMVLNQQDPAVYLKGTIHAPKSMMSKRMNLPSWSFILSSFCAVH